MPNPTQPSGVTQQLLMRSLERALAQLDIERLQRQTITIEVFQHAGPEVLIREFVTTWLRAHGVRVVEGREVEACPNDDFVLWHDPKVVTAVVLEAAGERPQQLGG